MRMRTRTTTSGNRVAFYRHHLNRRERGQWHHINPDMKRWRQGQILERVSEQAIAQGCEGWIVFDQNEVVAAQGFLV